MIGRITFMLFIPATPWDIYFADIRIAQFVTNHCLRNNTRNIDVPFHAHLAVPHGILESVDVSLPTTTLCVPTMSRRHVRRDLNMSTH